MLRKGGECFLCSNCDTSAHLRVLVGWWLLRFGMASPIFFFLVVWRWYSHARALPFPPRQCDSWACMLMCACLYTLAYRFNHTRLAEETEKCLISSWIPTLHITICTGQVEVKVRSDLWLFFFFSPPERNLTSCLAVIRLIYLFIFPKKRVLLRYFIPNLLLMGHSQYCKHCYAKLLLLCVYCALQGEVATFQKWRPCCVIFFTRALLLDIMLK